MTLSDKLSRICKLQMHQFTHLCMDIIIKVYINYHVNDGFRKKSSLFYIQPIAFKQAEEADK